MLSGGSSWLPGFEPVPVVVKVPRISSVAGQLRAPAGLMLTGCLRHAFLAGVHRTRQERRS